MSKLYIFGIGGTGSRVLKSLTMLLASGVKINADKIVVLEKGECVGIGTHKELLKTCESYREIASSQLSEEELTNA